MKRPLPPQSLDFTHSTQNPQSGSQCRPTRHSNAPEPPPAIEAFPANPPLPEPPEATPYAPALVEIALTSQEGHALSMQRCGQIPSAPPEVLPAVPKRPPLPAKPNGLPPKLRPPLSNPGLPPRLGFFPPTPTIPPLPGRLPPEPPFAPAPPASLPPVAKLPPLLRFVVSLKRMSCSLQCVPNTSSETTASAGNAARRRTMTLKYPTPADEGVPEYALLGYH